jgi:hypothetical protein
MYCEKCYEHFCSTGNVIRPQHDVDSLLKSAAIVWSNQEKQMVALLLDLHSNYRS